MIGKSILNFDYMSLPILWIKALNPLLATVELVSNLTNIWLLGTDTLDCLYIPVKFLTRSAFSLPPLWIAIYSNPPWNYHQRRNQDLFSEVSKYHSSFKIYLNKFEIQNNVGSKVWCNQPGAIGGIWMIRRFQNICVNI